MHAHTFVRKPQAAQSPGPPNPLSPHWIPHNLRVFKNTPTLAAVGALSFAPPSAGLMLRRERAALPFASILPPVFLDKLNPAPLPGRTLPLVSAGTDVHAVVHVKGARPGHG